MASTNMKTAMVKQQTKATSAIVPRPDVMVAGALASFAQALTKLAIEKVPGTLSLVKSWKDALDVCEEQLKSRLLDLIATDGNVKTEKGSKELVVNGYKLTSRPWRTGIDAKKLETMLRARGLNVAKYMDAQVSYGVNESKLDLLLAEGGVDADELKTCEYPVKMVLMAPKKVDEDGQ